MRAHHLGPLSFTREINVIRFSIFFSLLVLLFRFSFCRGTPATIYNASGKCGIIALYAAAPACNVYASVGRDIHDTLQWQQDRLFISHSAKILNVSFRLNVRRFFVSSLLLAPRHPHERVEAKEKMKQ